MSEKKHKKNWKDFLLSSGIPFEHTVKKLYNDLGCFPIDEFSYRRKNESGIDTFFSIDICATCYFPGDIRLDFLTECKYRHDSVRWVFTPDEYGESSAHLNNELVIGIDQYLNKRLDRGKIEELLSEYNVSNSGIEITPDSKNESGIKEGIYQLGYSVIHKIANDIQRDVITFRNGKEVENISLYIPILVTTAELWLLKKGVTIAEIKQADNIEDVCEKTDLVIYHSEPGDELKKYNQSILYSEITLEDIKWWY
jgi:hypothetical protein